VSRAGVTPVIIRSKLGGWELHTAPLPIHFGGATKVAAMLARQGLTTHVSRGTVYVNADAGVEPAEK